MADGFVRESLLAGEGKFCLAELALALSRVRPEKAAVGGLDVRVIADELRTAVAEIETRSHAMPAAPAIEPYVAAAFEEANA